MRVACFRGTAFLGPHFSLRLASAVVGARLRAMFLLVHQGNDIVRERIPKVPDWSRPSAVESPPSVILRALFPIDLSHAISTS